MRENGAKVVNSMLDVQLQIMWKYEWKQTIINDTNWEKLTWSILEFSQRYHYDFIKFEVNVDRNKAMNRLYIPSQTFKSWKNKKKNCFMSYFHGKTVGRIYC